MLAQGIVTGVVKWPQSFDYQVFRDAAVTSQVLAGKRLLPSWDHAHRIAAAMEEGSAHPAFDVVEGSYKRSTWQHSVRLAAYFPTQIVKIPLQALVLEGLGQDAWDEMRRRVHSLVWLPETFEQDRDGMGANELIKMTTVECANGALPALYHALKDRKEDFRHFLLAHSMAATAMNEAMETLRSVLEASAGSIEVELILCMAPACANEAARTTFTVLTTDANDDLAGLHDRMPCLIEPDDFDRWLTP